MIVRVITASELARYETDYSPQGIEARLNAMLGKAFEEAYTNASFRNLSKGEFSIDLTNKLNSLIYDYVDSNKVGSLAKRGCKIYDLFMEYNIRGRKPKTDFRLLTKIDDKFIYIAGQPDLIDKGTFYEFKIVGLNEYSRRQAEIFSWVMRKPIILIGAIQIDSEYVIEKEVIAMKELKLRKEIPKTMGRDEEFDDLGKTKYSK